MDKKIWAATFIDGTNGAYFDLLSGFPGIFDDRRNVELEEIGRYVRTEAEEEEYKKLRSNYLNTFFGDENGLPKHLIPKKCYFGREVTRRTYEKKLKGRIFRTSYADYVCDESSATALSKVCLGKNQLHKMEVYDEKSTLIEGFFLYMLEPLEKKSFLVEQSLIDMGLTYMSARNYYSGDHRILRKGPIVLSREALDCTVDIWCERLLDNTLFITDKLKEQLEKTGAAKLWKLVECKVEG